KIAIDASLRLRPMVRRRHARKALADAERQPRHFRAREQVVVRAHAGGLVEGADLDGDQAGPQLDLVVNAGAAVRTEVAGDAAAGLPFRPVGLDLAGDGEAVARHRQPDMERAAARALAVTAVADEAADRRSRRFVAHRAAQTLSRELHPRLS